MKQLLLIIAIGITGFTNAQTPCDGGFAGRFPCNKFDLQDHLSNADMDGTFTNDSWGWTDPENGDEYALIGMRDGAAFVDISNPTAVVYLGKLPTHTSNSLWRDIKVRGNYAFIVSEASGHGMQVFDLTRLRNVANPPQTFDADAHYNGFGNAHNIVINTESAYAYAVGTSTFNGGPHFIDISDPLNPTAAGGYGDNDYSHDAQVVTYSGPDSDYTGREILIGSNEDQIALVDITDKNNPIEISTITYSSIGYTHQGWFTEDQRYFLLGDELDERDFGFNTRTIIFDFEDLDNPKLHFEYESDNASTDHNGYVKDDLFYLASYKAGMRVLAINNISNQDIEEIAYFDTQPDNNNSGTDSLWNVYPYFESGNIVLSDTNEGFLLIKANQTLSTPETQLNKNLITAFPNPTSGIININSKHQLGSLTLYNILGAKLITKETTDSTTKIDMSHLPNGVYFLKTATQTNKIIKND